MPIRSVTRRYRRHRPTHHNLPVATRSWSGWIEDAKCGQIFYRSAIELDFFVQLIFDTAVARFGRNDLAEYERRDFSSMGLQADERAQVVLTLTMPDGRAREYTADLWVELADGRIALVEVGPHEAKTEETEAAWLQAAAVQANQAGYSFLVATDATIRGTLLDNLHKLRGHLRPIAASDEHIEAAHLLLQDSPAQLGVSDALPLLASRFPGVPDSVLEEALCHAIARARRLGRLRCDLEAGVWGLDTPLAIALPDGEVLPSFFLRLLEGGGAQLPAWTRPVRQLLAGAGVVDPKDFGDEKAALFRQRIALVRDREQHPEEPWVALAGRHSVSVRAARYWWEEFQTRGGEAALEPGVRERPGLRVWKAERVKGPDGKWHAASAAPEDASVIRRLITRLYRSSRKLEVKGLMEHPELRAKLDELKLRIEYDGVCRYVREHLKGDASVRASREEDRLFTVSTGPVYTRRSARFLLHIVEADATDADVLLVGFDGASVVKRVVVLVAIDVRSRMPWSWLVLIGDPDESDYRRLFHRGIAPKTDLCRVRDSVDFRRGSEFPCFGIPTLIALDRAWAGSAKNSIKDAESMGMLLTFAPPLTPELKAHIERLIGTINQRLLHKLPGTTKANPLKKGGRDAVAEALRYGLTVNNFIAEFDRLMLDGLPNELHTGLGRTPREEWSRLERKEGHPKRWPMDNASRLRLELYPLRCLGQRSLTREGYNYDTFLFRPVGKNPPDSALLYGDLDDARTVAVYTLAEGRPPVYWGEAVNREVPPEIAISFAEARLLYRASASSEQRGEPSDTVLEILERAERGKRVSRSAATRIEAVRQANARPTRSTAQAALAATSHVEAVTAAPRLVLERAPDFEES
jgi:hypothetical protein